MSQEKMLKGDEQIIYMKRLAMAERMNYSVVSIWRRQFMAPLLHLFTGELLLGFQGDSRDTC